MRVILDTNLWSSLGDDDSISLLEEILNEKNAVLCTPPSTLLEIVSIPHEDVRKRLIRGLASGPRRIRLPTEAESYSAEIVRLVRRYHPEWLRAIPNSSRADQHRRFWLKKVWAEALADSTRLHDYQETQRPTLTHVIERQKTNRHELLRTKLVLGPLSDLIGSSEHPASTGLAGWDGTATALWRLNMAQLTWYQIGVVGPRAVLTGEDRTMTDWVEPYVDVKRLRSYPSTFVDMWLHEASVEDIPRNWLSWAVDTIQWTEKVGSGNPADAQHAAYLLDCELFLTADVRFAKILERVRRDAPFRFASVVLVSGDRTIPTVTRIDDAWSQQPSRAIGGP